MGAVIKPTWNSDKSERWHGCQVDSGDVQVPKCWLVEKGKRGTIAEFGV
jgi:hypothetical protein